jgi:hypothetical protein
MKKTTMYALAFILSVGAFFSCDTVQEQENSDEKELDKQNLKTKATGENVYQYRRGNAFIISDTLAKASMKAYQDHIDETDRFDTLSYGAAVNLQELRNILLWADSLEVTGNADSSELYVMGGYLPNFKRAGLIFCLDTYLGGELQNNLYFDFTQPCPTSCPACMDDF